MDNYTEEHLELESNKIKKETYKTFFEDLQDRFDVVFYRGRNFYKGPAVVVPQKDLQKVIRATQVEIQTDSLGYDLIVYPL